MWREHEERIHNAENTIGDDDMTMTRVILMRSLTGVRLPRQDDDDVERIATMIDRANDSFVIVFDGGGDG